MNLRSPGRPVAFPAAVEPSNFPGTIIVGGEEVEPIAYWDFTTGGAGSGTLNGAPCAIADIFEEDTDFGAYSASDVIAGVGLCGTDGMEGRNSNPVVVEAVADPLIAAGYSYILEFLVSGAGGSSCTFYSFEDPNWNQELSLSMTWVGASNFWRPSFLSPGHNEAGTETFGPEVTRFRMAISVQGLSAFAAVNGSEVLEIDDATSSLLNRIAMIAPQGDGSEPMLNAGLYEYLDPAELTALSVVV